MCGLHLPDERLFGARLTPGTGIGKPEPRRERPNVPEAGSIGTLRAGNSNLVLAKTHLSLGFRWNSCRRPVHAGAGSSGGAWPRCPAAVLARADEVIE